MTNAFYTNGIIDTIRKTIQDHIAKFLGELLMQTIKGRLAWLQGATKNKINNSALNNIFYHLINSRKKPSPIDARFGPRLR